MGALQSGAQSTLVELVAQAKSEFDAQRNSNLSLRFDIQEEAANLRRYLEETRQGVAKLYSDASGGFATLQVEVQGQGRELQRLAGLAATGPGGGASPSPGVPGAPDPLQAASQDPWRQGAAAQPLPGTSPSGGGTWGGTWAQHRSSWGGGGGGGSWGGNGGGGGGGSGGGGPSYGGNRKLDAHADSVTYRAWRDRALDFL